MKKVSLKKLSFEKETISNLEEVKGGDLSWTSGCTDGCTGSATGSSSYHCTAQTCTDDCQGGNSSCVCRTVDGVCNTHN